MEATAELVEIVTGHFGQLFVFSGEAATHLPRLLKTVLNISHIRILSTTTGAESP